MKLKGLLALFFVMLCVAGCGPDYRELDHRSMIVGMAVDVTEEDSYELSFQMPVLGEGGQGMSPRQKDFEVTKITSKHLVDSFSQLEAKTPRVLFFGHLKAVVISSKLNKSDFMEIIDLLKRHPQVGNNVFLVITEKTPASELIEHKTSMVSLPALYFDTYFNSEPKMARTEDVKVFEYIRDSATVAKTAILPLAEKNGPELNIQNLAIYKNHEFVGSLIGRESAVALLLKNREMDHIRFSVNMEDPQGKEVNIGLSRIQLKMQIEYKKTNPVEFTFQFKGSGTIRAKNTNDNIFTPEFLKEIERKVEHDMQKEIEKVIVKTQQLNAEPYLLGQYIFSRSPQYFDTLDWLNTGWREAKFDMNIDLTIENTGTAGIFEKEKAER